MRGRDARMDESFIPWSQIEPLVTDGMTGEQLVSAVLSRIGLADKGYALQFPASTRTRTLRDALKAGVHVVKKRPELIVARWLTEPVR